MHPYVETLRSVTHGAIALIAVLALAGCGAVSSRASVEEIQPSALPLERTVTPPRPVVLAEGTLPALPAEPLAWVADRVAFYDRPIVHRHEAAFVYAAVTPSRLALPSGSRTLMPGQAAFVPAGTWHTHEATCGLPTECHDSFVEIRMAPPDARVPSGELRTKQVFASPDVPAIAGAPAHVFLELIDPAAVPEAADDGGVLYVRIPRDGYALGWRIVQESPAPRR